MKRSAEQWVVFNPGLRGGEFFHRAEASGEKGGWINTETIGHILLRSIVIVARSNRVAIDAQCAKESQHGLDFVHFCLPINRCIRGDLEAKEFRHPNCKDALTEYAFPLNNNVMHLFQSVQVHIPIHPFGWRNYRLFRVVTPLLNLFPLVRRHQPSLHSSLPMTL